MADRMLGPQDRQPMEDYFNGGPKPKGKGLIGGSEGSEPSASPSPEASPDDTAKAVRRKMSKLRNASDDAAQRYYDQGGQD